MSKACCSSFKNVTHCIFDLDGLLLDTEKLYTQATQGILDKYGNGQKYTWEVKSAIMGLQTRSVAEVIVDTYKLPMKWEEYAKLQLEATQKLMGNAELLSDTEVVYEEIVRLIAGSFGKTYPLEVRLKLLGTTEKRSAQIAITEMSLPIDIDEYLKRYHKLCDEMLGNSSIMRGAERLLRHLDAHKVPIALATSSSDVMVELKTKKYLDLFKLFHHRVCGSSDPEVKEGKPAPDIFLIAAARFADKPQPSNCLVFEDAPNGIAAATSAGMQCVMVPDEHVPCEMRTKATQVLKSLEDFKPEMFGLPPFDTCEK